MKKMKMVALLLVLCLCLGACAKESPAGDSTAAAASQPTVTTPTQAPAEPGFLVQYELAGKCEVTYTVNMSTVRYIDSPDKLPQQEGLEKYDAAWFQTGALLLIYETVRNDAVDVGIESIELAEGTAKITLQHKPGQNPGTTRLTTWLLWAEVKPGLAYDWVILNPAEDSNVADS